MMTRPTAKMPIDTFGLTITCGIAEKMRTIWPIRAMRLAYWIVR
jgi:hypothetical protein